MTGDNGKTIKEAINEMDSELVDLVFGVAAQLVDGTKPEDIAEVLGTEVYQVEAGMKIIADLQTSAGQQYGATSINDLRII